MANSWGNNGNSDRLSFLGSKITTDGDCNHEIKRRFLLGRKTMISLDNILKNRDIILPTKVCLIIAMVFPFVMYRCENLTINKAECWRIDAFELWCWRRLLKVPYTARRSNQSILKKSALNIHWKDWWSFSILATWCEELTHEMTLMLGWLKAGGEGDDRRWDSWMESPMQWTWVWVSSGHWWWTGRPRMVQSMGSQRDEHDWATELNWR